MTEYLVEGGSDRCWKEIMRVKTETELMVLGEEAGVTDSALVRTDGTYAA
jgi:hypothetical protein